MKYISHIARRSNAFSDRAKIRTGTHHRQGLLDRTARWTLIGLMPVLGFAITSGLSILVWGNSATKSSAHKHKHEPTVKQYAQYSPDRDDDFGRNWSKDKRQRAEQAEREVEFGPGH